MKKILVRRCLAVICLLATGLSANPLLADWIYNPAQSQYKKKYGDFPPENIDQQLLKDRYIEEEQEVSATQPNKDAETSSKNQFETGARQNQAVSNMQNSTYQAPNYGGYTQRGNAYPYASNSRNNNTTSFSGPWNNRGSSFSAPWNNNRSSFGGPRNNRGSSFSAPWNNNRSSFGGPWNSRGSSFSTPWNNNGSSFSPWGN